MMALPFFGCTPFLKDAVYKDAIRLSKEYDSPLVSLQLGSDRIIVLNSIDAFKALNDGPSERMESCCDVLNEDGTHNGILFNNGAIQLAQRKFAESVLEVEGPDGALDGLERKIHQELKHLEVLIESCGAEPVDTKYLFAHYAVNLQGVMMYGRRYEYGSDEMEVLYKQLKCVTGIFEDVTLAMSLKHWMRNIPCDTRRIKSYFKSYAFLRGFLKRHFCDHKANFDPWNAHDYMYLYIAEQEKQKTEGSDDTPLTDKDILSTLIDLFFEGHFLSEPLMQNALVALAMNPKCIGKMQEEMDEKLEKDEKISYQKMDDLPYCKCVYYEILRWASPVGLTLPVCSKENNVEILGFTVEKGTRIAGNVYAVHRDKNIWENPDEFDPKNFMDDDDKPNKNMEHVLNFGLGPRSFVGKTWAGKQLFLTIMTLIHRYDVKLPDGAPEPDLYPSSRHVRLSRGVISCKLIIKKRK